MSLLPYALVAIAAVLFFEMFQRLHIMSDVQRVFKIAPEAIGVIRSKTLADEDKEIAVRKLSLRVLLDTLRFTAKMFAVFAACALVVGIGALVFDIESAVLIPVLLSWEVLIGLVLLIAIYARLRRAKTATASDV